MKRIAIVILLLHAWAVCWAQMPPGVSGGGNAPEPEENLLPDVIELQYFNIDNLNTLYDYKDSTLSSYTHNYDPARLQKVDYVHLGNQGSAALPLQYQSTPYIGFHEGHTQYDLYKLSREDFKFFDSNVPMVNASFTPMQSQNDFVIRADFSRSFDDGISVASNYQRISQNGIYDSQATKITNFGVSLRYQDSIGRYTGFLSMISNVAQQENNGGVLDTAQFSTFGIGDRELIDPKLTGAGTRHQQKFYSLVNYYKLNKAQSNYDIQLRYDLGFDFSYYKYSDPATSTSADSAFYYVDLPDRGNFLTDDRGLRNYTRVNKINNAFYVYLSGKNNLNVRAGVVYDRYDIEQDIIQTNYNNVYLDFRGKVPFYKSLFLDTEAQLGIGDGAGDFNIDGSLAIDIGKLGTLRGGFGLYSQTPSLLSRQLNVSQIPVWNKEDEFTNTVGTKLYGKLTIPKLRLQAEIESHLITDAVFFDTLAMPIQADEIYSSTSVTISNKLSYSIFHLENRFLFQLMNTNLYGLPSYWSTHNFYLQFPMFKKNLMSRWGVETRFALDYRAANYNPLVGVWHQGTEDIPFYPMTDLYFSGKIQKFRIFIKLENLFQVIQNDRIDYRVLDYPTQDWRIRFGIAWLFLG